MSTEKKIKWAAGLLVALFILFAVYSYAKKSSVKVPGNGSDIPAGWDPTPVAIQIHDTIAGLGTDSDKFFAIMDNLTLGQRAMVYNAYNYQYGSLIEDIQGDFSGDELTRALALFKGIEGIALRTPINGYLTIPPAG